MPYSVYILYSRLKDSYYFVQTEDVVRRLQEHNMRKNLGAIDWILKYVEEYATRSEAIKRESEIKSKKRRSYMKLLINSIGSTA